MSQQQILEQVLDDNEVLFQRPNSTTQTLAVTCKTFAADVREVYKLWKVREDKVRAGLGFDRSGMSAYMNDLLAPLQSASKVYEELQQARAYRNARQNEKQNRKVEAKKRRRA